MIGTWKQVTYELKQPTVRLLLGLFAFSLLHMLTLFLPGTDATVWGDLRIGHLITAGFVAAYVRFLAQFGRTAERRIHSAVNEPLARHAVILLKYQVYFVAVILGFVMLHPTITALTGFTGRQYDILFLLLALYPIVHIGINIYRYLDEYTEFIMAEIRAMEERGE